MHAADPAFPRKIPTFTGLNRIPIYVGMHGFTKVAPSRLVNVAGDQKPHDGHYRLNSQEGRSLVIFVRHPRKEENHNCLALCQGASWNIVYV